MVLESVWTATEVVAQPLFSVSAVAERRSLVGSRGELELATSDLLRAIFPTKKAVRLLGVSISGFVDAQDESPVQITLL